MTCHLVIVHVLMVDGSTDTEVELKPMMTTMMVPQYTLIVDGISYHLWNLRSGH